MKMAGVRNIFGLRIDSPIAALTLKLIVVFDSGSGESPIRRSGGNVVATGRSYRCRQTIHIRLPIYTSTIHMQSNQSVEYLSASPLSNTAITCANGEYYNNKESDVPNADRPDF